MLRMQNQVGIRNKRKYIKDIAKLWLGKETVSKQAKTLNSIELRKVLDYVATRKHAMRNRALVLIGMYSGMRVGEIASLRYCDVIDAQGNVLNEIRLKAENTKSKEARTVFVSDKLQKELQQYAKFYKPKDVNVKFFYSQKGDAYNNDGGFSANTLTQFFHYLYKRVGIIGASSHSSRRTFATEISAKGVGIKVLQKLLGHKNIQTTSVYIFASDDQMRKAVNLA
ncbi:tyrosine-type recombinase/integrase [Polynucleobacter sp.]|uniref:tyrosine-type recombinase/integrase n=1 Tax=Polynucleobacter sp. TaxID=2029855 RepID=UPI003F69BEF6